MEKNKRLKLAIKLLIIGLPEHEQSEVIESVERNIRCDRIRRLEKTKLTQTILEDELRKQNI